MKEFNQQRMEIQDYRKLLTGVAKPTQRQTEEFIQFVANDHSWYKHLSNERKEPFVFYLDTNIENVRLGNWRYFTSAMPLNFVHNSIDFMNDSKSIYNLNIIDLNGKTHKIPDIILMKGQFMMSKYLHQRAFENANNFFENDGVSYADKHRLLITEFRFHLNSFLSFIYDDV